MCLIYYIRFSHSRFLCSEEKHFHHVTQAWIKNSASAKKVDASRRKKRGRQIFQKEKKPVGFCGTFGRPCRALALRWHNQILDGEILRGNGRHPAKKGLPARGEWKGHVGPWFCDGHTKFFAWNKQD